METASNPVGGSRWTNPAEVLRDLRGLIVGVAVLVVADLLMSVLLSAVLPERVFLEMYLDETYDEVIEGFRSGAALVVPDPAAGWRMRPDTASGNLLTDAMGARVHPEGDHAPDRLQVLLLGSSVMNGGLRAAPDETLAYYLESAEVHAINHGTMLHSLDQSLLAYRHRLTELDADVVLVGIHADHEAAPNLFVPLRSRTELFMPFLKPGFRNRDGRLELVPAPPFDQADRAQWEDLLDYLRAHDGSYDAFDSYRRWGVMPISGFLRDQYLRLRRRRVHAPSVRNGHESERPPLADLGREVRGRGARLLVLKFAEISDHGRNWQHFIFGDFDEVHDRMLAESGHEVLFVREILDSSGRPLAALYRDDGMHLTAEAYRLLADSVRARIAGPSP